jgi:rfaE bifunctional protein nucleotidyltransferase chain/domain
MRGSTPKIVSLETLEIRVAQHHAQGQTVVLTNGCFDLLHVGHAWYLQQARALGDLLIVGLNSDASTRRLKGPRRPLTPQDERAAVLAALACVDYVTIFEENTAEALVVRLRPAIYVKGGDYAATPAAAGKALPEAAVVQGYGGRVEVLPYLPGHSTSELIARIVARYAGEDG